MNRTVSPTYSHGGSDFGTRWPAVIGDASHLGPGRPISVVGAIHHDSLRPALNMVVKGTTGTCVVRIQCNGGSVTSGVPDPDGWIDALETNLSFDAGETTAKKIMLSQPYWRTNIVSCSGDIVFISYVPCIHVLGGGCIQWVSAGYPVEDSVGVTGQ